MSPYDALMDFQRQTEALAEIAGRLGWDQEVMMPLGAGAQRAEEIGALEAVLHARRSDARVGEWLAAIDAATLDQAGQAQLRLIRRQHQRAVRVPADLAVALARLTSQAQGVWAQVRADEAPGDFLPVLAEVVGLKREEGAALAQDGSAEGAAYDALIEDYEPGMGAEEIAALFARMRARLVDLRARIAASAVDPAPLTGHFPAAGQMALARELCTVFGYDMARGRLDASVHPFTSGSGQDVRITTRVDETAPFDCLYSTVHEIGHGAYEQNIASAYGLSPLGHGVSMGVHESQSRIYENQMARGRGFAGYLFERMRATFGAISAADADAFYGAVNRVHAGFIRTEADEVHYNLHVMLRFDLERALISGGLDVADLEEAWNTRFKQDFGVAVDRPSNGFLQDVHWSVGLFGYFPTYSLGNVYAGCLWQAMRAAMPDLEAQLALGKAGVATGWLRENVQRHGGLYAPREVIERACGFAVSEAPLMDYLDAKFGALYGF